MISIILQFLLCYTTNKSGDEVFENVPDGIYSPANPHPTLSDIQQNFTGGTMTQVTTTEPTVLYRVYNGKPKNQIGAYWSLTPQNGSLQSQLDLALNPEWGNTASKYVKIEVPAGTTIYTGTAGPQVIEGGTGILQGGGSQVFIRMGGEIVAGAVSLKPKLACKIK